MLHCGHHLWRGGNNFGTFELYTAVYCKAPRFGHTL